MSTSPAVGHTPQHTYLLTVQLQHGSEEVVAVVDTGVRALVAGKCLAAKLRIWKKARKVRVGQENGIFLKGNFIVNASFKANISSSILSKFIIDGEGLYIGNRNVILELS